MQTHESRVFSVCLRILGDRDRALDATQETFLTTFRKASQFKGNAAAGNLDISNRRQHLLRPTPPSKTSAFRGTPGILRPGRPVRRGSRRVSGSSALRSREHSPRSRPNSGRQSFSPTLRECPFPIRPRRWECQLELSSHVSFGVDDYWRNILGTKHQHENIKRVQCVVTNKS